MDSTRLAGLVLTALALVGYVLGVVAPYPGRALSLTGVMVGLTLAAVGGGDRESGGNEDSGGIGVGGNEGSGGDGVGRNEDSGGIGDGGIGGGGDGDGNGNRTESRSGDGR
jgi:hypothetical protein